MGIKNNNYSDLSKFPKKQYGGADEASAEAYRTLNKIRYKIKKPS